MFCFANTAGQFSGKVIYKPKFLWVWRLVLRDSPVTRDTVRVHVFLDMATPLGTGTGYGYGSHVEKHMPTRNIAIDNIPPGYIIYGIASDWSRSQTYHKSRDTKGHTHKLGHGCAICYPATRVTPSSRHTRETKTSSWCGLSN